MIQDLLKDKKGIRTTVYKKMIKICWLQVLLKKGEGQV